jgi:mono/diheme cytochrome c family protein
MRLLALALVLPSLATQDPAPQAAPAAQAAPAPAAAQATPAPIADLKGFYQMRCAGCHGIDGSAMRDGKKLKGQDFTDAKDMKELTDAKMVKAIQEGLFFGKRMPAYKGQINEADSLRLVQEVLRKAEKGKAIVGEAK